MQPVAIGLLVGFVRRLYELDAGINECRHVAGTSDGYPTLEIGDVPRNVPDFSVVVRKRYRMAPERKRAFLQRFSEFCGRSWTSLEEVLVPGDTHLNCGPSPLIRKHLLAHAIGPYP